MIQTEHQVDKLLFLMGGPSPEAAISRAASESVLSVLERDDVECAVMDVGDTLALCRSLAGGEYRYAFNLVHGDWGEDGRLTALLENYGLFHNAVEARAAVLCYDKNICKSAWRVAGLSTPSWSVMSSKCEIDNELEATLGYPVVCKPVSSGSSLGIEIVNDRSELEAVYQRRSGYGEWMLEQYITGREYSVGIIQDQLLPAIELVTPRRFYDYTAKYQCDQTQYLPAPDIDRNKVLTDLLYTACRVVGCSVWGRIDFICDDDNQVQLLELNSIPGMGSHSLIPKAAAFAGLSYADVVNALVANCQINREKSK